jgi:hypothetical protein
MTKSTFRSNEEAILPITPLSQVCHYSRNTFFKFDQPNGQIRDWNQRGVRQRFLHLRDIRVDLHLKQSGRWFISSQSGFNDSKKTYVFLVQHLMCL